MLVAGSFHQGSGRVCDQLLLGQGHLLPAVEQTSTEIRVRTASDDTILSVDTFHSTDPGRLIFTIILSVILENTDDFSGPGRAIGPLCVSLLVCSDNNF